ncbi:hypothetical protein SAMN04487819_1412 [Actinopolyspora alba]|uniref:Uncharacterized protein n=1 Tax=Actinopolyspora alba TaxID=673379 RepID=A0A1I2CTF7_9ACTN|nr:hypothetical protein [Actinopolyspora alba]SFE71452.1 hypothetical protein SAMN04487819_1412 [Actinopolyspora alba]
MADIIELVYGPLDGMTFPAEGIDTDGPDAGGYMVVDGYEQRAVYEPENPGDRWWVHRGWIP